MLAADLDLEELLDLDADVGVIRLAGERALLVDSVALGHFRKKLIELVGTTAAKNALMQLGYAQGWRAADALRKSFRDDQREEWQRAGARMLGLEGWVRVLPSTTHTDGALPVANVIWEDSYEAEQHLQHVGPSDIPACWTLRGWASGYLSCVHGNNVRCLEVRCRAKGDPHCAMLAKRVEDWEDDARGEVFFHEDCSHEPLEQLSEQLKATERLLRKRRTHLRRLRVEEVEPGIVIKSEVMRRVLDFGKRVAQVDSTLLILGESGVGKELVARLVHDRSPRAHRPFIAVNCAAIPDDLLESELFGHARGAFTGATQDRVGLFEAAGGGTLFLDEIGEITPAMQVALLRVLQDRKIRRVGENRDRPVDVRVIAATLRDLSNDVTSGRFREDLLYRLKVIELTIPPLRARREDVLPLARLFLANFSARMKRRIDGLTPEAADQLLRHEWPGNVRELENAMERAVALAMETRIGLADLPEQVRTALPVPVLGSSARPLRDVEKDYILSVLDRNEGNQSRTASQLGIGTATLYRKLKQYERPGRERSSARSSS